MAISTDEIEDIVSLTHDLRESDEPLWRRLRQLLVERGVEPSSSALLASFPDDVQFQYGVIVTADASVYQFGYSFANVGVESGTFTEWRNFTSEAPPHPCGTDHVEIGVKVARGESVAL